MYGNVQAMVDRFGDTEIIRLSQIEDRQTEEINAGKVERALTDATAMIDSYLRGRYIVPVASPPADLVRAACLIARYDLAKSARSEPTEQMQKDYDEICKWLGDVQKGAAIIDAPKLGNPPDGYGARFEGRPPVFTPCSLRGA